MGDESSDKWQVMSDKMGSTLNLPSDRPGLKPLIVEWLCTAG